jgi:hypothetical protein
MKATTKPAFVALVPPSIRFGAFQSVLLFALLLLLSSAALAQGTNCPPEPAQGTPIYDGEVYIGSNCTLSSPGDVDSFVFSASSGETYHLALGINGAAPVNICMTLYDPNEKIIFSGCTNTDYGYGTYSAVNDQVLTTSGIYTIVVTESSSGTISYALALERLYPFAPNAQQINLSTQTPGNINPITDTNEFTFASATTGKEEVSATLPNNATQNICMRVYNPDGSKVQQNDVCTNIDYGYGTYTVQVDFTPTQNGTSMVFLYVAGNDATATYTLEVSCLIGDCGKSTIPDVAGYIILRGIPLAGAGVSLTQPGAPGPQLTLTDNNGYYQFLHIISGEPFNVLLHASSNDLSAPASADAASADTVDKAAKQ